MLANILNPPNLLDEIIRNQLKKIYPGACYVVLTGSAREALRIALEATVDGPGSKGYEAWVCDFNCRTIIDGIWSQNLRTIGFFDVDGSSETLPSSLDAEGSGDAVVLNTSLFGCAFLKSGWLRTFRRKGGIVIDDDAHDFGKERRDEDRGDFKIVSFGNDKPLSIGKGGALLVYNPNHLQAIRSVEARLFRREPQDELREIVGALLYYCESDRGRDMYQINDVNHFVRLIPWNGEFKDYLGRVRTVLRERGPGEEFRCELFSIIQGRGKRSRALLQNIGCLAKKALRKSGFNGIRQVVEPRLMGENSKAALAVVLEKATLWSEKRENNYQRYRRRIGHGPGAGHELFSFGPALRYPWVAPDKATWNRVVDVLGKEGFEVGVFNWSRTLSKQLGMESRCSIADSWTKTLLNLPSFPSLSDRHIERICDVINENKKESERKPNANPYISRSPCTLPSIPRSERWP